MSQMIDSSTIEQFAAQDIQSASIERLVEFTEGIERLRWSLGELYQRRCVLVAALKNRGVPIRELTEVMDVTKQAVYLMIAKVPPGVASRPVDSPDSGR